MNWKTAVVLAVISVMGLVLALALAGRTRMNGRREMGAKKSHWVGVEYETAFCALCGGQIDTHFETTAEAVRKWKTLYAYCPHCGAKMDPSEYTGCPKRLREKYKREAGDEWEE